MLQYLIIILDDTSTSYCHYSVPTKKSQLISLDNLKKGIFFAMKENLTIQFVYPSFPLPPQYYETIDSIDHINIKPWDCDNTDDANILIYDSIIQMSADVLDVNRSYVLQERFNNIINHIEDLSVIIGRVAHLNVVFTDFHKITDKDFDRYKSFLEKVSDKVLDQYKDGKSPQINILSDRMYLHKMNNCNAGDSNITLSPDGCFYICPAFYYEHIDEIKSGSNIKTSLCCIGDLNKGLDIKNKQLYCFDHAPICSKCDAFQCKRCVWLNWVKTLEVNTPSREQCVLAHLERNAAKNLLSKIRELGTFLPDQTIDSIDYLDPFDIRDLW